MNTPSLPPVEDMSMAQLAGYLSATINTARLLLERGQAALALEVLTLAVEAEARRDARPK